MRIVAIIPARGGSKRLHKKNIFLLRGKPLIAYAIEACKKSKYINEVYVSSDDDEILKVSSEYNAVPLKRPAELADDATPKMEAIRSAAKHPALLAGGNPGIIIIPQANSPQLKTEDIDRGFDMLFKFNLWEVMSANETGVQNAAFRIIRTEHIHNTFLSAHCGFVVVPCMDVHTIEDIEKLENETN